MITADIITIQGMQAVKLPPEMHIDADRVSIRRAGDAVMLEPLKPLNWPADFWEKIHIADSAFTRSPQGDVPPAPIVVERQVK